MKKCADNISRYFFPSWQSLKLIEVSICDLFNFDTMVKAVCGPIRLLLCAVFFFLCMNVELSVYRCTRMCVCVCVCVRVCVSHLGKSSICTPPKKNC